MLNMNKIIMTIFLLLISPICFAEILDDDFANSTLIDVKQPQTCLKYNYVSTKKVPIKLAFTEKLGTEKDVYEGQSVELKILNDVILNNKVVVKKDTIAHAKIGIIISTGMNGIPASIILEDFEIPNIQSNKLSGSFELFGQDRSLFVFPLKWALTPLPPTGSLTNFIMGGHVKLKPKKKITVYYYPDWI